MIPTSLATIATLLFALALLVLFSRPHNPINRWFAAYTSAMSGWTLSIGLLHQSLAPDLWSRLAFASASFIPACFLSFTTVYPTLSLWPPRRALHIVMAIASSFALLAIATPLVIHSGVVTTIGFTRKSGPLYPLFVIYFLAAWLTAFAVFVAKWRSARGQARAQLQYLGIGLLISFVGGITTNLLFPFLLGRTADTWLGPYFSAPLVVLACHAIIRHRLMDLRLVIHRGLAYVVFVALVSGALIALMRWNLFGWSTPLPVSSDFFLIAIVTLITVSPSGQWLMARIIDPYIYRGRIEYAPELRNAMHRLSRLMQPTELATELRQALTNVFAPESVGIVARRVESESFENLCGDATFVAELLVKGRLFDDPTTPTIVVVNPLREMGPVKAVHEMLRANGIEILVTLGRRGQLLGAISLGPRRGGDAYFSNDLAFIESLAELASIALENALLYRQQIQIHEYSDRLLESLDSAVLAVDVAGKLTSFNPAAIALLGLKDPARGSPPDILPTEVAWALAFALSRSWLPREVEVTIDHETRGLLPVMLSTAVLHDDRKQVSGALAVLTDLSAIKALERNQRRVEHFALMARFYAGIAHEIRSPLAAISNFISMLPDRFDDGEYRDTVVRLLPLEVERIVRLADRIRLMAPSEDGKLSAVDLAPLLANVVAIHTPIAHDNRIKIALHCPDTLPKVLGDQSQLIQLFVNLLKNAIEAMPDGGALTIDAAHVTGRADSEQVLVRVIDEGVGLDPAIRSKIFQPFFTTKTSGTGLGLSICREIVDFHRARLTLTPRTAKGTVAEVDFPCLNMPITDEDNPSIKARSSVR